MIKVGDKAPDFKLVDEDGNPVTLSDFKGKKNVVLAFYPFDFSPVCTKENSCLTNDLPRFEQADTQVLGISCDSHFVHKAWKEKLGLKHKLLADRRLDAAKAFGLDIDVPEKPHLGRFIKRSTVIVGKDGIVRFVAEHKDQRSDDDLLKELAKLGGAAAPAGAKK